MNLYLSTYGSKAGVRDGRIIVSLEEERLADYPLNYVDSITLLSGVNVTPALIKEFSEKEKPIFWSNSLGKTYACLYPPGSENVQRRKNQYILSDNMIFCTEIARKNIFAKITNQLKMLELIFKSRPDKYIIDELTYYRGKLKNADSVEEIMGIEGHAAKLYFREMSQKISPYCSFVKRTRQPPKDVFSSALGFTYMLLYNTYISEAQTSGLDPYLGFVHKIRDGHYALASDLMEGLRPVICDKIVCSMFMGGFLSEDDFEFTEDGAVYLQRNSNRKIIAEFERSMVEASMNKTQKGFGSDWRSAMSNQVSTLVKAIEKRNADLYEPIILE